MPIAVRSRVLLIALIGAALAVAAVLALGSPTTSVAQQGENPNNTICKGSIKKSALTEAQLADDPASFNVDYRIACSGPITSYSIVGDREIDLIETEVFGINRTDGSVIPTDEMSCSGDIPGFGINCVGRYGGGWNVLPGKFNISADACEEPRLNPQLVVTFATFAKGSNGKATLNANGDPTVTTATAGPFDLGRPKGCPKSKPVKKRGSGQKDEVILNDSPNNPG